MVHRVRDVDIDMLLTCCRAMSSPVVAAPLSKLHTQLRKSVFTAEDETLAQFVAGVTIQVTQK